MPHIIEPTVYEFHELAEDAKEKARAWFREGVGDWQALHLVLRILLAGRRRLLRGNLHI